MLSRPRILASFALALLAGGCANQPLTIDLHVAEDIASRYYHLGPDGVLTVEQGSGLAERRGGRELFRTQVPPDQVRALADVVQRSGLLLLETPARQEMSSGPVLFLELELGVWKNRLTLRGAKPAGLAELLAGLNAHLPPAHKIEYNPQPVEREAPW